MHQPRLDQRPRAHRIASLQLPKRTLYGCMWQNVAFSWQKPIGSYAGGGGGGAVAAPLRPRLARVISGGTLTS